MLEARAELGYRLETRHNTSNQDELYFVLDNIATELPIFIESNAKKLGVAHAKYIGSFPSIEAVLMNFVFEYYIEEKNNKAFVQVFNRVLIHYYGYDGSEISLERAMSIFCKDLDSYLGR